MQYVTDFFILLILSGLYWLKRDRRRYYKKRIGPQVIANLYRIARNLGFMLRKEPLEIEGEIEVLKNGAIIYSLHYGVWESVPPMLRAQGIDFGIIVNRYGNDRKNMIGGLLDRYLYNFRSNGGVKIFFKKNTKAMIRFLKNGGTLGVLIDGNEFYSKFDKMKKLSKICNVPLIPFIAYRTNGKGRLKLNCNLEAFVKKHPLDYLWFYKSRKEEAIHV